MCRNNQPFVEVSEYVVNAVAGRKESAAAPRIASTQFDLGSRVRGVVGFSPGACSWC